MIIEKIEKDSKYFGIIKQGDRLISINGKTVLDYLDCMYHLADDKVTLVFETSSGRKKYNHKWDENFGISFKRDKIKICKNKCIFCFVHQQPKGMRHSLYVRDDDYRLSFTHGNFITFSNLSEDDMKRIVRQNLSPLYVSIHATDDKLRRMMFGNRNLPDIMPQLEYLVKNDITIHTQIVLCPGINDGAHLEKTIDDLYSLHPAIATLGVVPVGLTRYREKLPSLKAYDKTDSIEIIDFIEKKQKEFLKKGESRFVFIADEFYILGDRPFPKISEYETMEQFENGIGMVRLMLTDFNRRKRYLKNSNCNKRILILTGQSASKILEKYIVAELKELGYDISLLPIKNKFWGETVSVSGLLTGIDILSQMTQRSGNFDIAILPPNCLNDDNLFLDDMPLDEFKRKAGVEVKLGSYSFIDTINGAIR